MELEPVRAQSAWARAPSRGRIDLARRAHSMLSCRPARRTPQVSGVGVIDDAGRARR